MDELAGKRVLVLGLGRFGGGEGAVRFLCRSGAAVHVTDLRDSDQLGPTLAALAGLRFEATLGAHPLELLDGQELVVVGPAIPPEAPIRREIEARGLPCTSELQLFLERCPAPVLAVTGTNGKSTTTAMAGAILHEAGFGVRVGGNLGGSLLSALEDLRAEERVVLEVSSFQADLLPPGPWFDVLAVTHVTTDHLDRYRTAAAYQSAKRRMLLHLRPGGSLVFNRADPVSRAWTVPPEIRRVGYGEDQPAPGGLGLRDGRLVSALSDPAGEPILPLDALPLLGAFQAQNALAAAGAACLLGASAAAAGRALAHFQGLEHRLRRIGRIGAVQVLDNGVSTVPETTLGALDALERPAHVVIGGKSKGADLAAFARELCLRASSIHLFGLAGPALAAELAGLPARPAFTLSARLEEALDRSLEAAGPGESLLFSPAFSSFDGYLNFRERARAFHAWAAAKGLEAGPA